VQNNSFITTKNGGIMPPKLLNGIPTCFFGIIIGCFFLNSLYFVCLFACSFFSEWDGVALPQLTASQLQHGIVGVWYGFV
jgi:hypothetical protein